MVSGGRRLVSAPGKLCNDIRGSNAVAEYLNHFEHYIFRMPKILKPITLLKTKTWLVIVASIALTERVFLYLFYRPVLYHDTDGYRRSAEAILGGWTNLDGTRTPGYPVFLALFGPDERVYAAQLVLGLATTLLFFYFGWRISRKGWFGALAALAHTLNLGQLFFEANLISESLTTFLIAASLAWIAWLLFSGTSRPLWKVTAVGLAGGLTAGLVTLTRPLFIFLPIWVFLFLIAFWQGAAPKLRWSSAMAAGLAGLLVVGAWVNFIHQRFGIWSLSVMNGYNLVQHAGLFFEYLPDEYAAIRDTYIQFRDERITETGVPGNAIWDAIPDLEKVSGLGFIPLSNLLAKLSIQLIIAHPVLYLRNVLQGWLWFWKAPVYWSAASVANPVMRGFLSALITIDRSGMVLFNMAFILGSLTLIWKKMRRVLKMNAFIWFTAGVVWFTSIIQTLLDHGDNPRFSVPIQTLVLFVVLWWGISFLNGKRNENLPA
jgi:hypothetical protein